MLTQRGGNPEPPARLSLEEFKEHLSRRLGAFTVQEIANLDPTLASFCLKSA
jgi:hypothetical protein